MKTCGRCAVDKPLESFSRDKTKADGLRTTCKVCKKETDRLYAKKKSSEISQKRKERYRKNKDKEYSKQEEYRKSNPDVIKACAARYRRKNKGAKNASTRLRQARKLKATPTWLSQKHLDDMKNIYRVSSKISSVTGKPHHVDHVVPLRGENVCGLHVPWNLAILPARMNEAKGNAYNNWNK